MKNTQQYKCRRLANTPFVWRDGPGLISYKGKLWLIMGWNPIEWTGSGPQNNTNEVWSTIDGQDWQQETSFPASPSHTFGLVVKNGLIWVFGTDGQNIGVGGTPYVWTFDGETWTEVSASWGSQVGLTRNIFGFTLHKDYLYVIGGQNNVYNSGASFFNNVFRSIDGITWEKVSDFPSGMLSRSTPCVYSLNGKLYVLGGFTYTEPNRVRRNDVWVSENDGLTFNKIGEIPTATDYQNGVVFDGKMFILSGSKEFTKYPGVNPNRKGIHYSSDGITWQTLSINMGDPTHATGFAVHDGKLWIVNGNMTNQVVVVEKIY